jgi:hypothetical protein
MLASTSFVADIGIVSLYARFAKWTHVLAGKCPAAGWTKRDLVSTRVLLKDLDSVLLICGVDSLAAPPVDTSR